MCTHTYLHCVYVYNLKTGTKWQQNPSWIFLISSLLLCEFHIVSIHLYYFISPTTFFIAVSLLSLSYFYSFQLEFRFIVLTTKCFVLTRYKKFKNLYHILQHPMQRHIAKNKSISNTKFRPRNKKDLNLCARCFLNFIKNKGKYKRFCFYGRHFLLLKSLTKFISTRVFANCTHTDIYTHILQRARTEPQPQRVIAPRRAGSMRPITQLSSRRRETDWSGSSAPIFYENCRREL